MGGFLIIKIESLKLNNMSINIFEAFGYVKEKEQKEFFYNGKRVGLEEGIKIGLQRHFEATSELSDEEHELLIKFLVRHNFVLCIDQGGGFRIRRNDRRSFSVCRYECIL